MKHGRKQKLPWYVQPESPAVATFLCRACGATLTKSLQRLHDQTALTNEESMPLVPQDAYWLVAEGHLPTSFDGEPVDFTGCYAVHPHALVGVGNHPDRERWMGCCGPSGTGGPNRICGCGRPIGTERSDCMWPIAVYLEPKAVRPGYPEAEQSGQPEPPITRILKS